MAEETVGKVALEVVPKTDNFEQEAKQQLEPKIGNVMKSLAGAVATKKIFDFGKDAFKAADEVQKIGKQTEAVIRSTGQAAGVTADQVEDLATAISKKTAVDDEAIQTGENLLLTFTNIKNEVGEGNDIFNQATSVMVDMAAAMGTDASGGAIQLGKALNDPVAGISALTRVGVTFTETQKEQIKNFKEAGDTASAQKIILAELTKEFGGSAAAQATASDRMALAWDNLKEQIGGQLMPVVEGALGGVTKLVEGFGELPGPAQSVVLALGGLGAGLYTVGKVMDTVKSTTDSLAPAMAALRNRLLTTGADGTKAMTGLGKAMAAVSAVTAVASVLLLAKTIHDQVGNIAADVSKLAGATDEGLQQFAESLKKVAEFDQGAVTRQFTALADSNIDAAIRMRDAIAATGQATERYDAIIEETIASSQRRVLSEDRASQKIEETGHITEVTKVQLDEYNKMIAANEKQVADAGKAHDLWEESLVSVDQAMGKLMDTLFGVTDADAAWNDSVDNAIETLKKNGPSLDIWTQKGRENRDVLEEMVSRGGEWLGKIYEQEGASNNFKNSSGLIRSTLVDTMKQLGLSQDQIDAYLKAWDKVPSTIETTVKITAVGDWAALLAIPGLNGGPSLGEELNKAGASFGALGGNFRPVIPTYAMGGTTPAFGGLGVVGERGPELTHFGGTTAVFPHSMFEDQLTRALKKVGGGSPATTVNVLVDNVSYGDARQVGDMVGQSVLRVLTGTNIGLATRQGSGAS